MDVNRPERPFDKMAEMMARVAYRRTELLDLFHSSLCAPGHIEGKDLGCQTVTHEREGNNSSVDMNCEEE